MNVKVRIATIKDAKIANDYLTKLIQDEKQYDKNINENCVVNTLYENLIEEGNNCVLIAEIKGKVVGYLYGFLINGGDAYLEKVSQLEAMFVNNNYRGNNIGKKLISTFKKWSKDKGVKYIELKVWNTNVSAINLYEHSGFKDIKSIMMLELGE